MEYDICVDANKVAFVCSYQDLSCDHKGLGRLLKSNQRSQHSPIFSRHTFESFHAVVVRDRCLLQGPPVALTGPTRTR